ncbi:MAG: hypothetical protein HY237_03220 [Acidobacteria bacterium]|nr:hypothetical protein [Acidobacteriota bacterium]
MADAPQKADRFKAEMPQIPGVTDLPAEPEPWLETLRRNSNVRIAVPLAAALILGAGIAWWTLRAPRPAATAPPVAAEAPPASPPAPAPVNATPLPFVASPGGPAEVATLRELAKPWSSKKFLFRRPFSNETLPAIVVRLPGGTASRGAAFWAFSLQAPFGRCELEFVTDVGKLSSQYSYRAKHPMVADPCNGIVYDPLRMGTVGGGVWARGDVVQGAGIRPPISIEVRVQGNHLVAGRME